MNSILFIYTSKKHKVDINRFSEIKKYEKLSVCFPKDLRQKFSFYSDKNFYIGLSGLIHNQEELLKEYDKKDIFSLVISLYEKSEKDLFTFLNKLRGQQAFIIYDIKKDKILIINDKFGLYSCYFYDKDDVFIYSNCANTLLSNINFENNLNYDAISDYLSLGIVQNRETFARDVNNREYSSKRKK
jgi:asparagine synthetase B (glutamine-hydrolysing)